MDDEELPEGEYVELDDDQPDVVDTDDGGAVVTLDEDESTADDQEFMANLAETLPETALQKLSTSYLELIARDKEARKKRDEQYEDGIRRTGLGDDAPGGAQFQGASRVVHPMLTEVCVDFSSRAIKELFPPDGPVKSKIVGEVTKERVAKADRKSEFMNWQLTTQSPSFRAELEQLLTQVPLGGAQYLKLTWDEDRNRPNFLFVAIDDIYLPYAATNFYTAERKTHVQYITAQEYQARVKRGMYRDVDLQPPGMEPDPSRAEKANDKIEGRESTSYNEDGLRTVFEIYCTMEIDEDKMADGPAPYILTIDKPSSKVLSIYRNWNEDDATQEELEWIVEFPFVPWRGAYPIGIIHMIGGLSAAATGALRALLDSAHISNSQTMVKLKGGSRGGQTLDIQPTQVMEIEGGLNVDDVRKIAMPLPFNQPSNVLYQLLGFLVDTGKGVVRTTLDDMADNNQNVPVGTTLAKIEQGMVVFSAIHSRLHAAMERVLRVLHRLNGAYLDDDEEKAETGSKIAPRSDFTGPLDVVPVSDPNIFSEAQRFAQVQAVAQRASLLPQLYDLRKVEQRILSTLKIPDAESLLQPAVAPTEENAVAENVKAALGRAVIAFPEQDHIAHLKTHLAFMLSPALGSSQLMAPTVLPIMLNHIKEHMALWYAAEVYRVAEGAAGDEDFEQILKETTEKDDKQALDRVISEASLNVVLVADEAFGQLPPVIQRVIQLVQQLTPPPPMDPAAQAAMADIQMRGQLGAQKNQIEDKRTELKAQETAQTQQANAMRTQAEQAREQARIAAEDRREQQRIEAENRRVIAELQVRRQMNDDDNRTALMLAELNAERANTNPEPRT